jgi:hypothetical protein
LIKQTVEQEIFIEKTKVFKILNKAENKQAIDLSEIPGQLDLRIYLSEYRD